MPTYFARKAGNINAADVWATTPSGTASNLFPTFTTADVLIANSFTITVNVSTTVGEVRHDTTGGAVAGGTFTLSAGVTLTANCYGFVGNISCVTSALTAGFSATLVGNCYGGAVSSSWASRNTSTGTLNITGNIYGSLNATGGGAIAVLNGTEGTINVTGNSYGGNSTSSGIQNATSGIINLVGLSIGGPSTTSVGINNSATGIINITGQSIGGTFGAGTNNATSGGVIRVTRAVGNDYGPGNIAGRGPAVGVANSGVGIVEIEQLEFGTFGQSPVSGTGIRLKKANTNVAVFNYCDSAGAKTLIDATVNAAMPAATDVRSGVSYASGAATGSCAVPAAGSVALGVPVDAGFGTAVLTPEAVWGHASRTITEGGITAADVWNAATRTITGGVVTTLTNAPSVPTPSQIASQVRSELSVELARVDAAITTRATPANIPAADITAIKAKTDALVTDRLAQCSTVATTGAQLAAALS